MPGNNRTKGSDRVRFETCWHKKATTALQQTFELFSTPLPLGFLFFLLLGSSSSFSWVLPGVTFLVRTLSRVVLINTLTSRHIICVQSHDASQFFLESSVALPFSLYCCEEVVSNLYGSRPTLGLRRSASLSCHICSGSSAFTDTDGIVTLTALLCTSSPLPRPRLIVYSFRKRNDHILSFCRDTMSYRF